MKCKYETSNGRCGLKGSYAYRHKCYTEDFCKCCEPQTNADRIRAMSDEELEVFLCGIAATNGCGGCMVQEYCYAEHNGFGDWLKQPVKDGEGDE